MKDKTYETIMSIISVIAYILTTLLTIYICTKIYNAESHWLWKVIAVGTGIVINTSELLALTKYFKDKRRYNSGRMEDSPKLALSLACLFAFFSITASIGSIKITFDRGEKIVRLQDEVRKNMGLSDDLIKSYSKNADEARDQANTKRRLSNMYLQKSDQALSEARKLLEGRKKDIEYIGSSIENTIALSFYENFASVFGIGSAKTWVLIFAILLSIALEASYWFSSAEMYDIKRRRRIEFSKLKVGSNGKLKVPQKKTVNLIENENENVGKSSPTFSKAILSSGRKANVAKAERLREKILQIYDAGFTGPSEISRALKGKVTPQRVSQIKKEIGLK